MADINGREGDSTAMATDDSAAPAANAGNTRPGATAAAALAAAAAAGPTVNGEVTADGMHAGAADAPTANDVPPANDRQQQESGQEEQGERPQEAEPDEQAGSAAPGYLASALDTVFGKALAHTLKTCSYGNFAACFPTPAARRPDVLRLVWRQIVDKIEGKARAEYAGIMAERDVVRGLNELEALIAEAKARKARSEEREENGEEDFEKPIATHILPPEMLFGAHLAPELEPVAKDLQVKIDAISADNDRLAAGITRQKDEVEALIKHLEAAVKDLEGASTTLESAVEGHNLRKEVLDVQRDLNEVDSKL